MIQMGIKDQDIKTILCMNKLLFQISIIKINPDKNSPLKSYKKEDLILNNFNELFQKWKKNKSLPKPMNSYQKNRNEIKKKIINIFKEINMTNISVSAEDQLV